MITTKTDFFKRNTFTLSKVHLTSKERFAESLEKGRLLTLNDQIAHMFPTPRAANWATGSLRDPEKITDPRGRLEDFVVMYPTPKASDSDKELRTPGGAMKEMSRGHGISLPSHVRLYPTPTIHGNYNRKGASPGSGDGLETFVKLYPTPTCNDSKNNNPPSQRTENGRHSDQLNVVAGGSLNPSWVEWLMGFPIGWTDIGG